MTTPNRSTARGFTTYDELTGTFLKGQQIRIVGFSSDEGPICWISGGGGSPHLDVEQAKRVRDALDAFIGEHEEVR